MPTALQLLIHGLVLASEVELPLPHAGSSETDVTYRVELDTALPPSLHSRGDDPTDPWAIEHWLDGQRLAVEFPGWAMFELSRDEVVLVGDDTGDPDLVAHLLLDHVLPRVIALRGDLMLHASGTVGPSGRAHLFLGKTGAGKSTVAACLAAAGWALLDDDGIRVIQAGDQMRAVPGTADLRLLPDSAAVLLPDVPLGRPIADGNPKRRLAVGGERFRMATAPAPITAVYVLERSAADEATVERLGLARALSTIVEHGFHMADEPAALTRQAFERASALVASAPVWRLHHPYGLDRLHVMHELLGDLDERTASA